MVLIFLMFHIVLFEPRIPQNVGNIVRTCAVTGARLHLIKPYGFTITDKRLKRAGLTYWHISDIVEYDNMDSFFIENSDRRMFLLSSRGKKAYSETRFQCDDMFIFGREDTGVPYEIHVRMREHILSIPMRPHPEARCLNLSNSVAIVLYEALRQSNFSEMESTWTS